MFIINIHLVVHKTAMDIEAMVDDVITELENVDIDEAEEDERSESEIEHDTFRTPSRSPKKSSRSTSRRIQYSESETEQDDDDIKLTNKIRTVFKDLMESMKDKN
jgi:hypothetical protein